MKDFSSYPNRITLETTLQSSDEYPGSAFFIFDFDFEAVFGSKGRIPVWLWVGEHRYRSTIAVYSGVHMMVFNARMRQETGYKAGDKITVTLVRDTEIRKIELPEDVKAFLAEQQVLSIYEAYSYSHQKEALDWINDAKKAETRSKRIEKLAQKLNPDTAVPARR